MIRRTNAQSISRLLKRHGFNPHSAGDSQRWIALTCKKSTFGEVRVRVWSDFEDETPSAADREVVAEIAKLLIENEYKIRYTANEHFLYVEGKEI